MNMLATIVPRSDQLNADTLIGQTMTITITEVEINPMGEQPVVMHWEGEAGRPYKPGKSMRRVLVRAWGPDATTYTGRSLTLYCDEGVVFGGVRVGGIRISHMSHIDAPITMALTEKKGSKKPFVVKPLVRQAAETPARSKADEGADRIVAAFEACEDYAAVEEVAAKSREAMDKLGQLANQKPFQRADAARSAAYQKHMKPPAEMEGADRGDAYEEVEA